MAATAVQITANRRNAQRATGPTSPEGKQIVARNALKHGLFAYRPVLAHEDPEAYEQLMADLTAQFRPVGPVETALIERIALTLWRQQRLTRAEAATLAQQTTRQQLARQVSYALSDSFSGDTVEESDLEPPDAENLAWCQKAWLELNRLDYTQLGSNWATLKTLAPVIHEDLVNSAEEEGQTVPQHLAEWEGLLGYLRHVESWCRQSLQQGQQYPKVVALAQQIRDERSILHGEQLERLAKYQVMLDNDLIKALRTLREIQDWRHSSLEPANAENGFVLEKTASG